MDMTAPLVNAPSLALNELDHRQKRLMEIRTEGLPPFPHTVPKLTAILSSPSAEAKKAAVLIRTDPSLSAQALRMCNSPLFRLRSRVISIEQACRASRARPAAGATFIAIAPLEG